MYHLDPNLNTVIERQADRVRAVRAVCNSSNSLSHRATPMVLPMQNQTNSQSQTSRITAKVTLGLAAVAPIVLALVWAFAAR
jgi:hypothetical protein